MVSSGLSRTDMDRQEHLPGRLAVEFFECVGRHYNRPWSIGDSNPDHWTFEPHVAEDIFKAWLNETGPVVLLEYQLGTVRKQGNLIVCLRVERGSEFKAKVF